VNAEVPVSQLLLNTLIERKSISWTKIFADLSACCLTTYGSFPCGCRRINSQERVLLDMVVGARNPRRSSVSFATGGILAVRIAQRPGDFAAFRRTTFASLSREL